MTNDDFKKSREIILDNWPVLKLVRAVLQSSRYLDNQSKENARRTIRRLDAYVEGKTQMNPTHLAATRFLAIGGSYDGDFIPDGPRCLAMPQKTPIPDAMSVDDFCHHMRSAESTTEVYVKESLHVRAPGGGERTFYFWRLESIRMENAIAMLLMHYNPYPNEA